MFDFFGKFKEVQQRMEAAKTILETTEVKAMNADGSIVVIATGGRKIKKIDVNASIFPLTSDEAYLEELNKTVNKALEMADELAKSELRKATDGMLPDIPGFGL